MDDIISVSWATIDDVAKCSPCAEGDLDPDVLNNSLLVASGILFELTGRQWTGDVSDVVRPNVAGCGCSQGRPGCAYVSEVKLDGYPVSDIEHVLIDGETVDPTLYRVDDQRWLTWIPDTPVEIAGRSRSGWPCCQWQRRPSTEVNTFEVAYIYGAMPPPGGVRSAASLGCHLAMSCSPDSNIRAKCKLPDKTTSITRQGVTMQLLSTLDIIKLGATGLSDVDMWLSSILLGQQRKPAGFIDTQAYRLRGNNARRNNETVGS